MGKTKIFSISMVKNEADVIESFVRHNINVVDTMVILDHNSSDNTVSIIEKLIGEGLAIILWHQLNTEHSQDKAMTSLMYKIFDEHQATIIIPLDADEFIISQDGQTHPREILDSLSDGVIYHIPWRTYFPHEDDDNSNLLVPSRIQYCIDDYTKEMSKVVAFRSVVQKCSPSLSMGSHDLTMSRRLRSQAPVETLHSLRLAHFPIRSVEQLKSKILVGWINILSKHNRQSMECYHWADIFEKLKKHNQSISITELQQLTAVAYVPTVHLESNFLLHTPINMPCSKSIEMKYTQLDEVNTMRNILENSEALARQYAQLKGDTYSVTKIVMLLFSAIRRLVEDVVIRKILGKCRSVDNTLLKSN